MTSRIGKRLLPVLLAVAGLLATDVATFAQDYSNMSCDDLWEARNQIYADEGFCFKTDAALQEFGHRCYPPYGRLTRSEQNQVNEIQRWESEYGCN